MYSSLFAKDLFSQFDELQREVQNMFSSAPGIRGVGLGGYPALNIGQTPGSVEIYCFAPGLDPDAIDLKLDRGTLTISGERSPISEAGDATQENSTERAIQHLSERFVGRFRRVVSLPDDTDPEGVSAQYRDGVLRVSIKRREAAQPRRIAVQ